VRAAPVWAATVLLVLLSACGGGNDEGSNDDEITLLFQPDLSSIAPGSSAEEVLETTAETLRRRADLYGLTMSEVTVGSDNVIAVTVSDVDQATAVELFSRVAALEFKEPSLTAEGIVGCTTASGELFGVIPENVNPDPVSRSLARCISRDMIGDPIWEAASSGDTALTAASVAEQGWEPRADGLVANFTSEGTTTLEALTRELVGYRLALFLDGVLIAAPRIERPITGGQVGITGIAGADSRIRAAQLNGGQLPVKLTLQAADTPVS
jgi:preprotein translocase subunit SecD